MSWTCVFHSLHRNRGRYALFGILFAILGAVGLITLTLGSASDALRETLIDEYGRAVVLEDSSYAKNPLNAEDYARFNDPELVESMDIVAVIQANVVGQISQYNIFAPETETKTETKTETAQTSPIFELPTELKPRSY